MMNVKKYLTLAVLLLTGFLCSFAYAEQTSTDANLLVEGRAAIIKNDVARARGGAVKNAQEKAVLQIAEKILSDKYSDEKFQAVKSILIGKAGRFVKNYRIVSEQRSQDEYIVAVDIVVVQSAVREDLMQMDILAGPAKPRSQSVSVSLQGIKKYSDFIRLKSFLQSQNKLVKSYYPCTLESRRAVCELVIIGDIKSLIAEFEKEQKYEVEANVQNPDAPVIKLQIREEEK